MKRPPRIPQTDHYFLGLKAARRGEGIGNLRERSSEWLEGWVDGMVQRLRGQP